MGDLLAQFSHLPRVSVSLKGISVGGAGTASLVQSHTTFWPTSWCDYGHAGSVYLSALFGGQEALGVFTSGSIAKLAVLV